MSSFVKIVYASVLVISVLLRAAIASGQSEKVPGVDVTTIDRSIKPDVDFYQYANGKWANDTPIPADKPAIDAFTEVAIRNETLLKRIVEKLAEDKGWPTGSLERKIADFYRTGMDEALAERLGVAPLEPIFKRINALSNTTEILEEIARLHRMGVSAGFAIGVEADFKKSGQKIFQLAQGGIILPDRDYYLKDDPQSKALRERYLTLITKVTELAGSSPEVAGAESKEILALETLLAKASRTRVQLRDPNTNYNKKTLAELKALTPELPWERYFQELGLADPKGMNVATPEFFTAFATTLREVSLPQWKAYLRWHTLRTFGSYLSKPFTEETFRFTSLLTGQQQQPPRWRRVLSATEGVLGEALGQRFVAEAFSPEAKKRAITLVKNIQSALKERIEQLDWMGPETKAEALRKLNVVRIKVGYPDKWKDYKGLEVGTDSYVQNILRSAEFEFKQEIKKVGKSVDRAEWGMTPQTVNAYYNPLNNEIVFPAGILQPPFFDPKADDASNYGAIGVVIGHEMTHGFDDQGRQFDSRGNLRDWWTPEDAKRFAERSQALIQQYGQYLAVGDVKVNGELTQGENIADLGGLTAAYQAWKKTPQGTSGETLAGFTPTQRFFLAFGQIWRFKSTPAFMRLLATVDAHSPARWRVLGTLVNVSAFVEAFGAGESSSPARPGSGKVKIW